MAFRDFPIKRKLAGVILLTSFAVLGLTSCALLGYELYSYKESTRRTMTTLGLAVAGSMAIVFL